MRSLLTKKLLAVLLGVSLSGTGIAADIQEQLPDIGTAAGATLSINQELAMGDFYVRQLRGSAPLINDPLLNTYLTQLGNKLVSHADSVRTPFNFYLIRNNEINAFAFFGGNVVIHSSIFFLSDNESQLASVMAHEISHVTQRHLARAMEQQQRNAPFAWAGALGSILLAMANPQAGMAALSSTIAGSQQSIIGFTQANEQEADRIGMSTLTNSGFDPQSMPEFLQKLADQTRYSSKPPEMLLTHPLPESRLSDTRNRANQLQSRPTQSSQEYLLAKVRLLGMYPTGYQQLNQDILDALKKGNAREQIAAQYGEAINAYSQKNYAKARSTLQPLLTKEPNNIWFIDLMTDIDLGQNQYAQAISRLESALKNQSQSTVLQLNLANAYVEAKQYANASRLLYRYTYAHPNDGNGWDLLAKANALQGKRDEELAARAENLALDGKLEQAITTLNSASAQVPAGSLTRARYDARADQLKQLQQRFRQYQR